MVSCQEFIICKKFLNNCLSQSYFDEYEEDKEIRLKTYVEQIFGDNNLSNKCRNEICQKYFRYSKNELEKKVQLLANIQTGYILAPYRFPYVFSLSDYEQNIYFGIIDSYCNHSKKCDCRLVMPYCHKGEEWGQIYENLQEIFCNTTELLFLKMDKIEENLQIRKGLISKSIIRGVKIKWKSVFYQIIRNNKYSFRAFVTKDKKIIFFKK